MDALDEAAIVNEVTAKLRGGIQVGDVVIVKTDEQIVAEGAEPSAWYEGINNLDGAPTGNYIGIVVNDDGVEDWPYLVYFADVNNVRNRYGTFELEVIDINAE